MVKKNIFDVIFLDVHMPVMNGLETLKLIKQIRPEQAVVISSSNSDPYYSSEEDAKKLGARACFYKPFYIDEIFKLLDELDDNGGIDGK
jgi:CheY-like chemotaxis protein